MIHHAIERTSPKGRGWEFVGTCRLCGTPNLPARAALLECPNPRGLTAEESIVEAIDDRTEAGQLAARIKRNGRIHDAGHRELYDWERGEMALIVRALEAFKEPAQ